ncbi:MAG: hypothetical protein H8E66_04605 [Planctomycetes bacterium]|nr:hypothetical protein [Planctomycetota bacterium]
MWDFLPIGVAIVILLPFPMRAKNRRQERLVWQLYLLSFAGWLIYLGGGFQPPPSMNFRGGWKPPRRQNATVTDGPMLSHRLVLSCLPVNLAPAGEFAV